MTPRLKLIGRLASGTNGLLGAWIMLAPLLTGDAPQHGLVVWASLTSGGLLMFFGMTRLVAPEELPLLSIINLVLGAFIAMAPWLLRFAADEDRMWAAVTLGGSVMVLGAASAKATLLMRERLLFRL